MSCDNGNPSCPSGAAKHRRGSEAARLCRIDLERRDTTGDRAEELEETPNERVGAYLASGAFNLTSAAIEGIIAALVNDDQRLAIVHSLYENLVPDGEPSHWLCEFLAEAAEDLDPATYAEAVLNDQFKLRSQDPDVNAKMNEALQTATIKLVQVSVGMTLGDLQLRLAVLVLAVMVCPEPRNCPTSQKTSSDLLGNLLELRT